MEMVRISVEFSLSFFFFSITVATINFNATFFFDKLGNANNSLHEVVYDDSQLNLFYLIKKKIKIVWFFYQCCFAQSTGIVKPVYTALSTVELSKIIEPETVKVHRKDEQGKSY
jgi:hypothetical protein